MLCERFRPTILSLLLVFGFSQSALGQKVRTLESSYVSPDFRAEIFREVKFREASLRAVDAVDGVSLALALVGYANQSVPQSADPAKALVLAWVAGRSTEAKDEVIKADFYFRLQGKYRFVLPVAEGMPSTFLENEAMTIARAVEKLLVWGSEDEQRFAAYCRDLLKNNEALPGGILARTEELIQFEKLELPEVDWTELLKSGPGSGKPRELTMNSGNESSDLAKQFAKRQSLIKGLLVIDLGASKVAGQASQMNATVTDGSNPATATTFSFNQEVGDSMQSALGEVVKFIGVRHDGFPGGKKINFAFEEQYSNKDGPSAAVACSLMLDSLMTGDEIDSGFAVTGDMNADGSVQPVGGIAGKVRGAANRSCTHIAIPRKNAASLEDWIILGELAPLVNIQVFSIGSFEEAAALAAAPEVRESELQNAIETFKEVQKVLQRPNGMTYLTNSHVKGRLQEVIKAAPNHESARLLLVKGSGNVPATLSLRGSFDQIDRVTRPIIEVLETGKLDNSAEGLNVSMFALRRIRSKLDPRARSASDALEDLSGILKQMDQASNGPRYRELFGQFENQLRKVKTAYNALASDSEIQEELIQ